MLSRKRSERTCERGLCSPEVPETAVDTFERYTDATLFQALDQHGLAALLIELRELDQSDPECTQHIRVKTHDDATAPWLAVD